MIHLLQDDKPSINPRESLPLPRPSDSRCRNAASMTVGGAIRNRLVRRFPKSNEYTSEYSSTTSPSMALPLRPTTNIMPYHTTIRLIIAALGISLSRAVREIPSGTKRSHSRTPPASGRSVAFQIRSITLTLIQVHRHQVFREMRVMYLILARVFIYRRPRW